jgi:hypothetical protein
LVLSPREEPVDSAAWPVFSPPRPRKAARIKSFCLSIILMVKKMYLKDTKREKEREREK